MSPWSPVILIVLGAAVCFAADFLARGRAADGDSGAFWSRVCGRFCLWIGLPLLIVTVAQAAGWSPAILLAPPADWMAVVFLGWVALCGLGLLGRAPADEPKWLAGAAGFSKRRFWLLGFVAVLVPAIYGGFGGWTESWRAAHWTFAVLLALSLTAAALSLAMRRAARQQAAPAGDPTTGMPGPWPEAMRMAGIALEPIRLLPAGPMPLATGTALDWEQRLAARGSRGAAPEMLAAVCQVATARPSDSPESRTCLILAPDDAGQAESIAMAALEVSQRTGEVTLVITPSGARSLAQELRRWSAPSDGGEPALRVDEVDSHSPPFEEADVWVASAETLSEFLLAHLQEDADKVGGGRVPLLHRIGLVVWWEVHRYSGIKAANVWAISRRLVRLLGAHGRSALRTLVMGRNFPHAVAQATAFIAQLLPYPFSREREVRIESRQARDAQLYLVGSGLAETVAASVRSGWRTCVGGERASGGAAESAIWHLGPAVREKIAAGSAAADARILALDDADVLALDEIVSQGGRAGTAGDTHHVALLLPENPYARFVVNEYREKGRNSSSRYLVGAEGHAGLVRRHAEHALREAPDTMTGLRNVFRWEEEVLASTLRDLSARNQLSRQAVRFLNPDKRLQRDYLYASLQPYTYAGRPLETFGTELLELRDLNAGEREGLLLRVDPERATIDAYPRRVFFHDGRRYRVHEWRSSTPEARMACSPEDRDVRTWRCRNARLQRMKADSAEMVGRGRRRYSVSGEYWEELTSVLELAPGAPVMPPTDLSRAGANRIPHPRGNSGDGGRRSRNPAPGRDGLPAPAAGPRGRAGKLPGRAAAIGRKNREEIGIWTGDCGSAAGRWCGTGGRDPGRRCATAVVDRPRLPVAARLGAQDG